MTLQKLGQVSTNVGRFSTFKFLYSRKLIVVCFGYMIRGQQTGRVEYNPLHLLQGIMFLLRTRINSLAKDIVVVWLIFKVFYYFNDLRERGERMVQ